MIIRRAPISACRSRQMPAIRYLSLFSSHGAYDYGTSQPMSGIVPRGCPKAGPRS
jgi:hypothetical protein